MKHKSFKYNTAELGDVTLETRGKRGIYQVSFHFKGSHVRRSLKSSNKTIALENLSSVLEEFAETKVVPAFALQTTNFITKFEPLSLTKGLDYYLDSLRAKNCPPKDVQQAQTRITAFIDHAHSLGVFDFESVLPIHADSFYRGLTQGTIKTRGKKKKHVNTAVGYYRFVKALMEYLESRGLISTNAWRKIHFNRVQHKKTPQPSLEQLNAILKLVEPGFFVAAHALAFLGCRDEALTRIQTQHVKVKSEHVFIESPPHRSKTVERYIPIHPRLLEMLESYKRPRSSHYFCTLQRGRGKAGNKMNTRNLNAAIQRAAKKAGFAAGRKEDGFVAHSLRGFFKSHCLKQGIPREVVDIWQGHRSDSSVGTRHYFELTIEESIEFMKKVDFGS